MRRTLRARTPELLIIFTSKTTVVPGAGLTNCAEPLDSLTPTDLASAVRGVVKESPSA